MSEAMSKMAAIFFITVMCIIVPLIFVNTYTNYKKELKRQEMPQAVDFMSFEGGRNEAVRDNFYLNPAFFLWESDF